MYCLKNNEIRFNQLENLSNKTHDEWDEYLWLMLYGHVSGNDTQDFITQNRYKTICWHDYVRNDYYYFLRNNCTFEEWSKDWYDLGVLKEALTGVIKGELITKITYLNKLNLRMMLYK